MLTNEGRDFNVSVLKQVLIDQNQQRVHCELFNDNVNVGTGSKLRTYRNYTGAPNKMEDYLNDVPNFKHRKAFSRLRISNHQLAIETGRHSNIPLHDRTCNHCPGTVETEIHFLSECTLYDDIRTAMYDGIISHVAGFGDFNVKSKLKVLMQPRGAVSVLVAAFVHEAFTLRKRTSN